MKEENRPTGRIDARRMAKRERAMLGLMKLLRSKRGATAIEYALIASLISVAAIAAMNGLGGKISTMYNNVSNQLN